MKINLLHILLFLVVLVPIKGRAQFKWGLETNYVFGLGNKEVEIWNENYQSNHSHGFEIKAVGFYGLEKINTDVMLKVGYKHLFFSGLSQDLKYNGTNGKLVIALGGQYKFTQKLSGGLFFEMENNRNIEDLRLMTSDQMRYGVSAQINYNLSNSFGLFFAFHSAFYPIYTHHIIFNPQHQIRLGVNYIFFKE